MCLQLASARIFVPPIHFAIQKQMVRRNGITSGARSISGFVLDWLGAPLERVPDRPLPTIFNGVQSTTYRKLVDIGTLMRVPVH